MGITVFISHCSQSNDNGVAAAQYLFENFLGMLAGREIEQFGRQRIKFG
jgi:hypothetical protein